MTSLYKQALKSWYAKPDSTFYIGTTDTAKLIRAQLKAKFPGIKFSVRSDKYSGGSSIRINWEDGPTDVMVTAIVSPFAGSGFDGMQDMKYSIRAWLMPDGSAALREIDARWGSDGDVIEAAADGAIPVSFCADFVFTRREISRAAMERAIRSYGQRFNDELAYAIRRGDVQVEDGYWGGYSIESASRFEGIEMGTMYRGGDCALRAYVARRMVAPR